MTGAHTAWAAGLYEGEGSICVHMSGPGRSPSCRMTIVSTDLDVLQRFHAIVAVGNIHGPNGPYGISKKPQYRWNANGWDICENLISDFWFWLSERRRDQALTVFTQRSSTDHRERDLRTGRRR